MKVSAICFLLLLTWSCKNQHSKYITDCLKEDSKILHILNDSIQLTIPKLLDVIDTTGFFNIALVHHSRYQTRDTMSFVEISVYDFSVYPGIDLQEKDVFNRTKITAKELANSDDKIIKDAIIQVNGNNV
jgi:hypothetical protein